MKNIFTKIESLLAPSYVVGKDESLFINHQKPLFMKTVIKNQRSYRSFDDPPKPPPPPPPPPDK